MRKDIVTKNRKYRRLKLVDVVKKVCNTNIQSSKPGEPLRNFYGYQLEQVDAMYAFLDKVRDKFTAEVNSLLEPLKKPLKLKNGKSVRLFKKFLSNPNKNFYSSRLYSRAHDLLGKGALSADARDTLSGVLKDLFKLKEDVKSKVREYAFLDHAAHIELMRIVNKQFISYPVNSMKMVEIIQEALLKLRFKKFDLLEYMLNRETDRDTYNLIPILFDNSLYTQKRSMTPALYLHLLSYIKRFTGYHSVHDFISNSHLVPNMGFFTEDLKFSIKNGDRTNSSTLISSPTVLSKEIDGAVNYSVLTVTAGYTYGGGKVNGQESRGADCQVWANRAFGDKSDMNTEVYWRFCLKQNNPNQYDIKTDSRLEDSFSKSKYCVVASTDITFNGDKCPLKETKPEHKCEFFNPGHAVFMLVK